MTSVLFETFPGWPAAPDPSPFFMFMLCLGAPILVGIVVWAIGLGGHGRKELAEQERAAGLSLDSAERVAARPMRRAIDVPEGGATEARVLEAH